MTQLVRFCIGSAVYMIVNSNKLLKALTISFGVRCTFIPFENERSLNVRFLQIFFIFNTQFHSKSVLRLCTFSAFVCPLCNNVNKKTSTNLLGINRKIAKLQQKSSAVE